MPCPTSLLHSTGTWQQSRSNWGMVAGCIHGLDTWTMTCHTSMMVPMVPTVTARRRRRRRHDDDDHDDDNDNNDNDERK